MNSLTSQVLFVFAVTSNLAASQNPQGKGRVVCYYEQWAIYRGAGGTFAPKDINPYLCTHLIYSFAEADVEGATLKSADENADFSQNGFRDIVDLRTKYNEDLKVLLAIGGYNSGSRQFTPISAQPEKRKLFARNSLEYLRKYGFDGLNIDWQFPNDQARSGDAEDFQNFPLLLKDIEKVFAEEAATSGNPKLLLTISVPGKTDIIEPGYDLPELAKYVEFMNVLCYDYHYAYDPYVSHHSPIYPLPEEVNGHENEGLNADATINYILGKGVRPDKLNLGIPLYGRGFTLEDEGQVTLGSPATGQGAQGKATRETGYKAYFELCKELDGYAIVRANETALGPFAYKGDQWVGYDDEQSARRKGEYAKKKGLGGISFWAIDQDDFNAACGTRAYPLIKAAREGYIKAQSPPSANKPSTISRLVTTPPKPTSVNRDKPSSPSQRPGARTRTPAEVSSSAGQSPNPSDISADYGDVVVYDAATSTAQTTATSTTIKAPSGMIQNVYIWITNNIFHHSPPQYVDSSVQSNKHGHSPSTTTPGVNQGHPGPPALSSISGTTTNNVGSSETDAPSQASPETAVDTGDVSTAVSISRDVDETKDEEESSDGGESSQISPNSGTGEFSKPVDSPSIKDDEEPSEAEASSQMSSSSAAFTGEKPAGSSSNVVGRTKDVEEFSESGASPSTSLDSAPFTSNLSESAGSFSSFIRRNKDSEGSSHSNTGAAVGESSEAAMSFSHIIETTNPPCYWSETAGTSQAVEKSPDAHAPSQVYNTAVRPGKAPEPGINVDEGKPTNPKRPAAETPSFASLPVSSTDVSVVHVSSFESSSAIGVPSTSSTPKRYTHYYNGVPVWASRTDDFAGSYKN